MGAGQRRTTEIARGLFAVRYVGADDAAQPPHVKISVDPECEPYIGRDLAPRSRIGSIIPSRDIPYCPCDAAGRVSDRGGAEPS